MIIERSASKSLDNLLPKGNVWNFDRRNSPIYPSHYAREIKNLDSTPKAMQTLIGEIDRVYIKTPWKFESLLIGKPEGQSFALIYTNPMDESSTRKRLMPSFVAGNRLYSDRELIPHWIDTALQGTNLFVKSTHIGYISEEIDEPHGVFKKSYKSVTYYKLGVGYILLELGKIQDQINTINSAIAEIESKAEMEIDKQSQLKGSLKQRLVYSPASLIND